MSPLNILKYNESQYDTRNDFTAKSQRRPDPLGLSRNKEVREESLYGDYFTSTLVAWLSLSVGFFFGRSSFKIPLSTLAETFDGIISSGNGTLR